MDLPALMPISIVYRDEHLVAINKPAGMLVHPGRDKEDSSQVAMKRVRDLLGCHVFPVHRLDRPTSGVLLFALESGVCARIQHDFETRKIAKRYLAVVEGCTPPAWMCDTPLSREDREAAKPASTAFQRIGHRAAGDFPALPDLELSLVEAKPTTGRFHQIRRHLQEAGHPICGDFRYAGVERSLEVGDALSTGTRMLLHAESLIFTHPLSGTPISITAPPDEDFARCFPALGDS